MNPSARKSSQLIRDERSVIAASYVHLAYHAMSSFDRLTPPIWSPRISAGQSPPAGQDRLPVEQSNADPEAHERDGQHADRHERVARGTHEDGATRLGKDDRHDRDD